jgi:hypothetical protein
VDFHELRQGLRSVPPKPEAKRIQQFVEMLEKNEEHSFDKRNFFAHNGDERG